MNEKIVAATMTFLGLIVGPVVSNLLTRPMDVWTTAVWFLLVLSVAGVVIYIFREEKVSRPGAAVTEEKATTRGRVTRRAAKVVGERMPAAAIPMPVTTRRGAPGGSSVAKGFLYVLAAALCWSIGNILLRITAHKLPNATFDIAVLNYLVASIALIASAWVICRAKRQAFSLPPVKHRGKFWLVAAAKGLNTYAWILSVGYISAASAATLEGLHVVFTVFLLVLLFRVKVPMGSWLSFAASSMVLTAGAVLILGMPALDSAGQTWLGIAFGILSGFFFSVFYVLWEQVGAKSASFAPRALETGVMLLASLLCLFPIHILMNALLQQATLIPFSSMGWDDVGLQAACGLIGIGGTYVLITESLFHMQRHKLCSLLLGIGLSYSVPFTMIMESVFLREVLWPLQWIGGVLFGLAFAAIYRDMRETRLLKPVDLG